MIGDQVRAAREARGMSLRKLAALVPMSPGYLSDIERGARVPRPEIAAKLAALLDIATTVVPPGLHRDAIDALARVLAAQRRLEDAIGAAPVLAPTVATLRVVSGMVADARGPLRPHILEVAGQWAQFAGWLQIATGAYQGGARCLDRTADWAQERDDPDMASTVLNLRGYIAWKRRRIDIMAALSEAAGRDPRTHPALLAMACQQQARAHAILGDGYATDRLLDRAVEHTQTRAEAPMPPWVYFYGLDYLTLQRGRAYRLLGRHAAAADLLTAGLAALPPDMRYADWAMAYQADLEAVTA